MTRDDRDVLADAANGVALERLAACDPVWVAVAPALEAIPGMDRQTVLHSGPPIPFEQMAPLQRNAVCGALLWEGLAASLERGAEMVAAGNVRLLPNHQLGAVNPMAGVLSASMPVFVVEDRSSGRRAWTSLYEGPYRERLSFGSVSQAVLDNLTWLKDTLAPALGAAVDRARGIPLRPLMSRAVGMGDECHNRLYAATAVLTREIAPALAESDPGTAATVFRFLLKSDNLALNLAMPAMKLMSQSMHGVPDSTLVTTMARNGVQFGIKVSCVGDRWFTAPTNPIEGVYFAGFGPEDAGPDIGDSCIAETVGLGGLALPASPAMVSAVGGDMEMARRFDAEMRQVCAGVHHDFTFPALDFIGAPVGIDVRKVVDTGIAPIIDTGIAHRDGGQIGVGLVRAPASCFFQALRAIGERLVSTWRQEGR